MKELSQVLEDWEAVIGLEVHTELTTLETKMFCNCKNTHDDPPNTNVCPVCLGMPGALPVPNRKAIQYIVMAGLATNCEIQRHSMFYRKHYFYPDMAKNFQTTQGPVAFCMHGHLDLEVSGEGASERPAWEDVAGDGETRLGTKTEMKNINSFKSLHDALEYEICRQAEVLEEGGIIYQETRHWEPSRRRTVVMRVKETADDYRLFPDPDLAPFDLTDDFIEEAREKIPELPDAKRDRYMRDYGLKRADAAQLAGDPAVADFFEKALEGAPKKVVATIANVMVNLAPSFDALSPAQVRSISGLLAEDAITFAQAREALEAVNGTEKDPERVVDERGMRQVTDTAALEPIVDEVLARCTDQVQQYRDGNKKVVGYLVGQCMKAAKGSGNPKAFNKMLAERLEA